MDRNVFISCFLAVVVAFLFYDILTDYTSARIAWLILLLIGVILLIVAGDGARLGLPNRKRRSRR